ncbi:MAG: membrane protein insertase YidC [Candidatus Coatesbacteria bacterium]|nr:membrane protein insertase YidC [Candidatus Coatesbacteria bacterium]
METKNLILAVVLVILVMMVYNYFFAPKPKPKADDLTTSQTELAEKSQPASSSEDAVKKYIERQMVSKDAGNSLELQAEENPEKEIVVQTDLFTAVFSTDGGAIKSFRLRRYKDLPPEFRTAKEKLLRDAAGDEPLNEFQLANARKTLSEAYNAFRENYLGKRELTSEEEDKIGELVEQFGPAAKRVYNTDLLKRRATAKRIRESMPPEDDSGDSYQDENWRRIEQLEGVELVPPYLSEIGEYMLQTVYQSHGSEAGKSFKTVQFETSAPERITLNSADGVQTLRFETSFNEGAIRLTKEYRIDPDSYTLDLSYEVQNSSSATVEVPSFETWLGPDIGSAGIEQKGRYSAGGIAALGEGNILTDAFGFNDLLDWAALQDRYFIVALVAKEDWLIGSNPFLGGYYLRWVVPASDGMKSSVRLFAGPKDIDQLKKFGDGLERVVDFGWFSFISEPLYVILKYIYSLLGNYGLAIIVLALLIKIVFYPLTVKQTKSMKKMQLVQPKMKELRERYKNDKERLNKEIMELYKKHEVNPMGGCLPMLIQFPILIALIRVLPIVIDLRQAPFILWLHDLSEPDPYYITPILMGVAMIVQQKLTPSSDPKQARMMLMMSVVFTFFFLNFSSGLVLYWLCGTVFQLIQQLIMNKRDEQAKAVSTT